MFEKRENLYNGTELKKKSPKDGIFPPEISYINSFNKHILRNKKKIKKRGYKI